MRRALAAAVAVGALTASPAAAQSPAEHGSSSRGLLRDASSVMAAQDVVDRAGLACRVTDALRRGRDDTGADHYEVACAEGPGFVVVGTPPFQSASCLALDEPETRPPGAAACRLTPNRNLRRHFARMAADAGVACAVERGAIAGLAPSGRMIVEIACRGPEGYWLEETTGGWTTRDCLTVRAQGGQCRLTPERDDAAAFERRLAGTALAGCRPGEVRVMGEGEAGVWYALRCRDGDMAARLGRSGVLEEVVPCTEAGRIGGGCRLGRDPAN